MIIKPAETDEYLRLLAKISDDAPVSITVHDFDGTILYANEETFRLHGFTREEFLAKNLHEIDVAGSKDLIDARMQQIKENGEADFEVQHFRKDGSTIPLHVNVKTVDWGGRKALLSFATDITERKQVEEVQQASEIRYRRLFESTHDGILILDAGTGQIVDANPFLINLLGFSHEQFLGKKIWEIGFFRDIVANKDNFEELQRKEHIRYENLPLQTADGRSINVEFVSNVYMGDNKKVIQCNIRDITERKLAEDLIRILNEQLTAESTVLYQTQDELRTLNNRLEDKVRKRTTELKHVNMMLTEQNLTLQIMNAGTRALLIVQDEAGFMPQICNDLVRTGVYSHVWLAGIDTEGNVGIVATAGDEYPGFFRTLASGQLPACTDPVRKTGGIRVVITPDPACAGCPLSRLHAECSTIVVRLDAGEKSVGLLGVTLQPGISTTSQETERIVQIAQEIAFVILHLRTKELEQSAFNQITKNLEQLAILNDTIRNPLQGIVGYAGIEKGEPFTKIIKFAMEINSIVTKLDEGYLKSKKIRDFMERHEHVTYIPDRTSGAPAGKGTGSPPHPPG